MKHLINQNFKIMTTTETKNQIKKLEKQILMNFSDMSFGKYDFQYFVKDAIEMKLHAFMSNDYPYNKPNADQFSDLMHNFDMLKEAFEALSELKDLEGKLEE